MTKKSLNQNAKYSQEILDTIEPNFKFNKCPINRFKIVEKEIKNLNYNKKESLLDLKKKNKFNRKLYFKKQLKWTYSR